MAGGYNNPEFRESQYDTEVLKRRGWIASPPDTVPPQPAQGRVRRLSVDVLGLYFALAESVVEIDYSIVEADTLTTIATALAAAINASSTLSTGGVTATSSGVRVTITKPASASISVSVRPDACATIAATRDQSGTQVILTVDGTAGVSIDVFPPTFPLTDLLAPSPEENETYPWELYDA